MFTSRATHWGLLLSSLFLVVMVMVVSWHNRLLKFQLMEQQVRANQQNALLAAKENELQSCLIDKPVVGEAQTLPYTPYRVGLESPLFSGLSMAFTTYTYKDNTIEHRAVKAPVEAALPWTLAIWELTTAGNYLPLLPSKYQYPRSLNFDFPMFEEVADLKPRWISGELNSLSSLGTETVMSSQNETLRWQFQYGVEDSGMISEVRLVSYQPVWWGGNQAYLILSVAVPDDLTIFTQSHLEIQRLKKELAKVAESITTPSVAEEEPAAGTEE